MRSGRALDEEEVVTLEGRVGTAGSGRVGELFSSYIDAAGRADASMKAAVDQLRDHVWNEVWQLSKGTGNYGGGQCFRDQTTAEAGRGSPRSHPRASCCPPAPEPHGAHRDRAAPGRRTGFARGLPRTPVALVDEQPARPGRGPAAGLRR